MKNTPTLLIKRIGLFALLLWLAPFGSWALFAQTQVQVTINVMPPYSAYLQDYAGVGQQIQVIVRNTTLAALDVRLPGRVEGDNGVLIQTLPNFRPNRPLKLMPGETRILTRADLEGSFDLSQINVEGLDKNLLYQGKPLPEGNYQLCIQAFDNRTSQPLSSGFPLGCSPPFSVRTIEPPILISPLCDTDITPTTPQATVFTWSPPAGILPTQVSYTLRIIELPLQNVDPNVFIDAVALPPSGIEVKNLPTSTFLYGPQYLPLKVGKRYAWRVQAVDKFGKLNLLNDGKSPVCAFQYGQPIVADSLGTAPANYLVFTKPGKSVGKTLPELTVGYGNPLYLSWGVSSKLADLLASSSPSGNLLQKGTMLNSVPGSTMQQPNQAIVLPGQDNDLKNLTSLDLTKTNLSYRLRIRPIDKSGKVGPVLLDRQVKTPYFSGEQSDLPPDLGTKYQNGPLGNFQAELDLVGLTPSQQKSLSVPSAGVSAEPRPFRLTKKNTGDQSDSVYVKGVLTFSYPGETGGGHVMPNTLIALKRVESGGYENNMGYTKTNAQGEFTVAVLRLNVSPPKAIVAKSGSGPGDTTYSAVGYRVVPANIFLLPAEQTFTLSAKQVGTFDAGRINVLAKGYQVSIAARQAYKNWPGAPDINLAGKRLVIYRKPNQQVDDQKPPVEGQVDRSFFFQQSKSGNNGGTIASSSPGPGGVTKTVGQIGQGNSAPVGSNAGGNKSAVNANSGPGAKPQKAPGQEAVEKAGYVFVGTTVLVADGSAYKASLERLLYSYNPLDRYAVYCPDCGQQPDDAEPFRFSMPQQPLSAVLARTESYTFNIQTTEAPTVTFTGKLNYKFADAGVDGAAVRPLGLTNVRLQVVYKRKGEKQYEYGAKGVPPGFEDFHKTLNPTLATGKTDKDGNITFNVKLTKPLALGELAPVTEFGGNNVGQTVQNVYVRTLRVLVGNEQYAHPSGSFGDTPDEKILPQGSYDLGNLTAIVRSYGLTVNIKTDTTGYGGTQQQVGGIQQALSGIMVYVLRRTGSKGDWPNEEGQSLTETYTYNGIQYPVVSKDKTNAEGVVNFSRLVMALDNANSYLIATASQGTGINNSKPIELKSVLYDQGWVKDYLDTPTQAQIQQAKNMGPNHIETRYKEVTVNSAVSGSFLEKQPYSVYWLGYTLGYTRVNQQTIIHYADIDYYGTKQEVNLDQPFAENYQYFTAKPISRYLVPGKPSITLRVVDATNPLQGIGQGQVSLYNGKKMVAGKWSGNDGYAQFAEITPGTNAILTVEKEGYLFDEYVYYDPQKKDTVRVKAGGSELKINLGELKLGQNIYIDRVLMLPDTKYVGSTIDADAVKDNPAVSPKPSVNVYVQIDNGMYNKAVWSSVGSRYQFSASAPGNQADSLKILPVDISYFNEYRLVKALPKSNKVVAGQAIVDVGAIPVFQRDHRIMFQLLALDNNKWGPVKGGTVKLFGRDDPQSKFQYSDKDGLLETKFKNVTVENLFVGVSAPGYVTKTVSVTNVETKNSVTQQIFLEPASLIKGVVVAKGSDGKETPLPGADVFVSGGTNAQTPYSTTAGPGGAFTLAVGKQLANVTIQATYQSTVVVMSGSLKPGEPGSGAVSTTVGDTYIGAIEKNYGLPQDKNASLKLTLTPFSKFKIATIWGFPVKVESLTALPNGTAKVSGEVELSGSNYGPFAVMDPDLRVRFENVIFKPSAADPTVGEPASINVPLKTGILDNLGYYSKPYNPGQTPLYNVRLTATNNVLSGGNLQIVRSAPNESTGIVTAQAQIIDNSFKFSENLLNYEKGQFFLYDPAESGQPGNQPTVIAFRSGGKVKRTDFGLSTKDGQPIKMELLAFKATSSLEGSRLKGDEIHLNPTLTCTLKDANPSSLTVNVGDLVLKNNTIDAKSSQTPLTFMLANKWSVEVRNWVLDYKQGGFFSTEGVVKTGKVDVPISLFNLRADFFKLEATKIPNLDLAGLAKVDIGGKAIFGFDKATGSDMKGHWALVVVPDGKNQAGVLSATTAKLPGLSSDLAFETISLLDNGEDVFSFGVSSQSLSYYQGVMTIRPKAIETGADYFAFDAGMSTTIPNAPKDVPMRLTYYRPGGSGPVTLKTIVTGDYIIDTKGQVQFVAGQDVAKDGGQKTAFYFTDGIMAIRGMAREKDKLQLGQTGDAGVVLVHSTLNGGYTYLTHDRKLDLNNAQNVALLTNTLDNTAYYKPLSIELGSKTFGTVYCNQPVDKGQWELLRFSGIPNAYTMIPEDETNRLTFTNYGSIRAENQKIKADGIGGTNGFPGMTLEYDMAKSRFTGTVTLPPNMPLPPTMRVEQGVAQVRIDGSGFYLAASATVHDVPLIIPVTMKAGLMLGYYASSDFTDAEPILFSNTHRKALPCAFKQTFKGVFVNGEIPIPIIEDFKFQKNFGFGSINTGLSAYVDGYVFGNYDNKTFNFGTGLGTTANFYAYGSILNVSAGGELTMTNSSQFDLNYDTSIKKVSMAAKMNMGAELKAAVHVDLGVKSYDTSGDVGFCIGMSYPELSYTIGGGVSISKPSFEFKTSMCTGDCSQ